MPAKYLVHENALARIVREYRKYGKLIVAYDFDDTICTYTRENPEPTLLRAENEEICQLLRDLRPYCEFILWTCRTNIENDGNGSLKEAIQWIKNHNIPLDYINTDGKVSYGGRKIYTNILLDDRAGLSASYALLCDFLWEVKTNGV